MLKKINIVPRWIIFLIDIFLCNLSLAFAYLIGHNLNPILISLRELGSNLVVLTAINTLIFFNFKTYAGIVRYTGVQDALRISLSLLASFVTLGLLYSSILVVHGWRLDPILLFSQVLIIASVLGAGWENIRLRGLLSNIAKFKSKKTDKN